MSQKRHPEDCKARSEGSRSKDKRPKFSFKEVVLKVMNLRKVQCYMEPILEPVIRRVILPQTLCLTVLPQRFEIQIFCSGANAMVSTVVRWPAWQADVELLDAPCSQGTIPSPIITWPRVSLTSSDYTRP
ncbi:hypothetical protein F0562_023870 [Nyssa sinensis]|uniref:Uncharacterized protein n=1 Tax=Nyssa sinensis TaxID=561372 RepID=A0A5J5BNB1_9ASTE|nr:hypothetical protein F0562_023870 [Nyssa sinensis]